MSGILQVICDEKMIIKCGDLQGFILWLFLVSVCVTGRDITQAVEHSAVKDWILLYGRSILHGGCIFSLGYFPFQPVVHNWSIKGCGMCCPVCGKVHIKDPLLLIGNSSQCYNDRMLDVQ